MTTKISAYKVLYYDDMDILNQGSIDHVKNYFDNLEKQNNITQDVLELNKQYIKLINQSKYSINNITFFTLSLCTIILIIIIFNYVS